MKVTGDMMIGDVLEKYPEAAKFFLAIGMHCLGCPSARSETIEQACVVHNTSAKELLTNINEFLGA